MRRLVVLYTDDLTALNDYIKIADGECKYHHLDEHDCVIPNGFNSGPITKDGKNALLVSRMSEASLYGFISHLIAEGYLYPVALTGETHTITMYDEEGEIDTELVVPALHTIKEYQSLYTDDDQAKVDLCWDSTYIDDEGNEQSRGLRPRDLSH